VTDYLGKLAKLDFNGSVYDVWDEVVGVVRAAQRQEQALRGDCIHPAVANALAALKSKVEAL
jgi:hypothetical protein